MNRTVLLGIAIFFAVVGIALLGGEQKAVAGGGCNCYCDGSCYGCDCSCACDCGGRQGLFARLRARKAARGCHGCHGCNGCHAYHDCCGHDHCNHCYVPVCHGGYDCGGYGVPVEEGYPVEGGAPVESAAPEAAPAEGTPAPPPAAALDRAPVAYRQVSFRR